MKTDCTPNATRTTRSPTSDANAAGPQAGTKSIRDECLALVQTHMPQILNGESETSQARFKQQSSKRSDSPHLNGEVQVNKKPRREAEIQSPGDRLALAGEPKIQGDNHYTQLTQKTQANAPPLTIGRIQDPVNKNAAGDERHTFQIGSGTAPSYPEKGKKMEQMNRQHGLDNAQGHQVLKDAMLAKPLPNGLTEGQQRDVATAANIVGISEQRRSPFMAHTSAQRIDHASDPNRTESPESVFGKKSGGINQPGTLPASGKGAKQDFKDFEKDIAQGQIPPEGTPARPIYDNVRQQQADLMNGGFSPKAVERLQKEGASREFIVASQMARMTSAASRDAAQMTGQLPYNLRSLKEKPPIDGGGA
jgi:hypothetical protein